MSEASKEIPRYKCHKEVRAMKIKAIVPPIGHPTPGMHRILEWEDPAFAPTPVPEDWIRRHNPEPGGYYVAYEDGYISYSPAEPFEKGYTLMNPPGGFKQYENERLRTQITKNFTYHPPKGNQGDRYVLLRNRAGDLADLMARNCPESRELSLAMTKLEEAVMWANAAIARNE